MIQNQEINKNLKIRENEINYEREKWEICFYKWLLEEKKMKQLDKWTLYLTDDDERRGKIWWGTKIYIINKLDCFVWNEWW